MNIIFDLDGTLADCEHRIHYVRGPGRMRSADKDWESFHQACGDDKPIQPIINVFRAMSESHSVKIWSGRNSSVRIKTVAWLAGHINDKGYSTRDNMRYFDSILTMRSKDDRRLDHIMKEEWLLALPKDQWPDLVFDDRQTVVDMWRKHGIRCCQVAFGDF